MSCAAPLNVLSLGSLKIRMRGYRQLFILPYQLAQSPFLLFKWNENRVLVTVGHLVDRQDTAIMINHLLCAADQE